MHSSPSTTAPHLSPSVTVSADSFSLPSPKGSDLALEPQLDDFKRPSGNRHIRQPGIRRMSASDTLTHPRPTSFSLPSSPSYEPSHKRDTGFEPRSHMRRFHPYSARSVNIPPGLDYAARSLGITSPHDWTIDEVRESKDAFIAALTTMPDTVLLSAFDAKLADHDCISKRIALATAEIKSAECRTTLLATMRNQHSGDLAVSQEYLQIIKHVLDGRELPDVEAQRQQYQATRALETATLTASDSHVRQIQEVIGSRKSRWWGKDPFEKRGVNPFDRHNVERQSDSEDSDEDDGDEFIVHTESGSPVLVPSPRL